MVKLEEIEDDTYANQANAAEEEGDWDTDSGTFHVLATTYNADGDSDVSDVSADDETSGFDESLAERLYALKDMVPPAQRRRVTDAYQFSYSWGSWGLSGGLKLAWQVTTSVLLLAVPFGLVSIEEQMLAVEEEQQRMRAQGVEVAFACEGNADF